MSNIRHTNALVLSQNYHPELIGSGPYLTDMAEHMVAHGMTVDVVTNRPNYPEGHVPTNYRHGQKDFEIRNGVTIHRLKPTLATGRGAKARLIAECMFLLRGLRALMSLRRRNRTVVVSLCPSIFTVLLGWVAAGRRASHVALVHDIQSGLAAGLSFLGDGRLLRWLQQLEAFALNRADIVLVLSEQMQAQLRAIGVRSRIEILPIWIDTQKVLPKPVPPSNEITLMYSGNFGRKQHLSQIIEMAAGLQRKRNGIRIVLRGQGGERLALEQKVRELGLGNVSFGSLVSPEELADSLGQADIHIVSQHPDIADFAVPSKVYTIMAAGRPFVAAAPEASLLWQMSDRSRAFICVPSGDVEALIETVDGLARDRKARTRLGENGRNYVVHNHDRNRVLDDFMGLLDTEVGARLDAN
ncbi:MAG: glycosyltransferase family 4 protein [Alphaproteobacteria bacterium]|nr:glycosyltransferase family 4 protein [Alphaproteobacteria bacterium]